MFSTQAEADSSTQNEPGLYDISCRCASDRLVDGKSQGLGEALQRGLSPIGAHPDVAVNTVRKMCDG